MNKLVQRISDLDFLVPHIDKAIESLQIVYHNLHGSCSDTYHDDMYHILSRLESLADYMRRDFHTSKRILKEWRKK